MLWGFAKDACKRHRSIISSIIFLTFLKNRSNICLPPIIWYSALSKRLIVDCRCLMYIQVIQQFEYPFRVNCDFTRGGEWASAFWGDFSIRFASESWLKLSIADISLIEGVSFQNSIISEWIDPKRVFLEGLDKWPKLFRLLIFSSSNRLSKPARQFLCKYLSYSLALPSS